MLRIKRLKGIVVFSPRGIFTQADLVRVRNLMSGDAGPDLRGFVFNFSETKWMPINTMAILADGIRNIRAHGGDLRIVGLRGSMKRLFDFFVFTGMIDIYPNEKQAVRSFGLRKEAA